MPRPQTYRKACCLPEDAAAAPVTGCRTHRRCMEGETL